MQKLEENHEKILQLTSQWHQMQEQMNSMNDSTNFQDLVPNKSGRLSHVSSQPAMIPSSRSMLSRDKRINLDYRKTFLESQFSTFDSPRGYSQCAKKP